MGFYAECAVYFYESVATVMEPVYFLYRWLSSRRVFYVVFATFSLYWISDLFMQYFFLEFAIWDTVIQAQPLLHWVKYGQYWLDIMNVHPWNDHFYAGLLLLMPLIAIVPSPMWLPIAKVLSYLSCSWLFFHYGKKHFKDLRWATVIPIWWFFQDIIMGAIKANSHPTSIALPLFVLAFFFALEKRFVWMWLSLIILVLFKEHLPLAWVSLGMFLIVETQEKRQGIWLCTLGVLAGLLIFFVIMPSMGPEHINVQQSRFGPWAAWGLKALMMIKSLLPFGFIHLMRWRSFLYILPIYGAYLASQSEGFFWVGGHYHDIQQAWLMCILFYLIKQCLDGQLTWPRILQRYPKPILTVFSVAVVGIGINSLPIIQDYAGVPFSELKTRYQVTRAIQSVRHAIPEGVYIYTTEELGMFFADRYLGEINGDTLSQTRPHVIVYRPSSLQYYKNFDYEGFHNQIQLAVRNQTLFQIDIAPDLMLVGNNVPSLTSFKNDIPAKGI